MSDSEDDTPRLSAYTLAALQEFFAEQKQHTDPSGDGKYNVGIIEENWQLSQFWYSRETALRLAQEAVTAAGDSGRRFAVYGEEFVFYDYNNPLDLPDNITAQSFDIVIADPPYLSEECLRKTSETIKYLTRGKILLCTGAVMEASAAQLLGVKMCAFLPKHTRNLANEFRCYVNYNSGLDCGT
ncbi:EEF1A lysine methyltransferase 1 isoform 2-T2 [Erethizon dorsatum]